MILQAEALSCVLFLILGICEPQKLLVYTPKVLDLFSNLSL